MKYDYIDELEQMNYELSLELLKFAFKNQAEEFEKEKMEHQMKIFTYCAIVSLIAIICIFIIGAM